MPRRPRLSQRPVLSTRPIHLTPCLDDPVQRISSAKDISACTLLVPPSIQLFWNTLRPMLPPKNPPEKALASHIEKGV